LLIPSYAFPGGCAPLGLGVAQTTLRALVAAALSSSAAQAAWPNDRPIEIVVGYQAGSGPDILARRMAPAMAKHLRGASFFVTNRPGASGEIALAALSRSEADGYTIGTLTTPSFIIVEHVKKPQYDPAEILPLARVVDDPTVIVAGDASAINDFADVIGRLRADPASLTIGHNGIGTNGHLAILAIERAAGVRLIDVPFKGTSESRTALLGGHVDLVAMSVSEFAMDRDAKGVLKAVVQFGRARAEILPDVPTARDAGFDIEISTERGFAARRGVPADIIARLEEAIAAAVIDPEFLRGTTSDEMAVAYLPAAGWMTSMAARKAHYEAIWSAVTK
jgi:tripartite-type tricarboxylate transporter receptor subunit TctC